MQTPWTTCHVFVLQTSGLFHFRVELIPGVSFCDLATHFMVCIWHSRGRADRQRDKDCVVNSIERLTPLSHTD